MAGLLVTIYRILAGAGVIVLARIGAPLHPRGVSWLFLSAECAPPSMDGAQALSRAWSFRQNSFPGSKSRPFTADCAYLSAWNLGMFLVSGFHDALVGRFSFRDSGTSGSPLPSCSSLPGSMALSSPPCSPHCRFACKPGTGENWAASPRGARIGIYITALTCLPLLFAGKIILAYWVTPGLCSNGMADSSGSGHREYDSSRSHPLFGRGSRNRTAKTHLYSRLLSKEWSICSLALSWACVWERWVWQLAH